MEYKYFAFISYNLADTKWGKMLSRKLENYKMSTTLCSQYGCKKNPIRPVFFAPYEIQPGDLDEELKKRLKASKNLIVICSPNSAKSEWVGKEIAFFHSLGRSENIYFFIVSGIPDSGNPETECYNPVIRELGLAGHLGVNVNEKIFRFPWLNRERAFVQLITKFLGIEFDTLWKRHKRWMIERLVKLTAGVVAVLAGLAYIWVVNVPKSVNVRLVGVDPVNASLPEMRNAVVTITVGDEVKTDTVSDFAETAIFKNIPAKLLGSEVKIAVSCEDYNTVDTTVILAEDNSVNLSRNASVYGKGRLMVYSSEKEAGLSDCKVFVEGKEMVSDKDGYIYLDIPLESQKVRYSVRSEEVSLIDDSISMPVSENAIILVR